MVVIYLAATLLIANGASSSLFYSRRCSSSSFQRQDYWEIHISGFPLLFYNFPQSHLQHSAALPGDVQQCEAFVQTLMPDAIIYNFSCDIQAKVIASFCQRNICPIGARAAVLALLLYFGNTSVNWWNDHKFGIRRVHFTTCSIVQKSSGEFITFVCGLLVM